MIEEIAKNIYRIAVTLPDSPLRSLNSYLIKDSENSLLIDTGFRREACKEDLMAGLLELGQSIGDFDIFLTHIHADHSGLAPELVSEGRRMYISDIDIKMITAASTGETMWDRLTTQYVRAGMPDYIVDNMATINPAIKYASTPRSGMYTPLRGGDVLSAGGYSFRCVHTPGHTPGHMCLWSEDTGIMLTGDHVLFDITPNITTWRPLTDDSLGDYLQSLSAINSYPVLTALPGHRKSGDFHARVKALLEHHERRLAEVVRIVSESPGINAYDIAGKMKWRIRASNWDEFPAAQKIFAVGECVAHLDYLCLRDKLTRKSTGAVDIYFS